MTVPNENYEIQFTLTAEDQVLATNFYFLEADDLTVTKTSSGVDTPLVLNSDYTVQLPATVGGVGSVTMTPGTIGDIITIANCPDCTQLTDYVENDRFPAAVHERVADKLTMLVCKIFGNLFGANSRFIRYPNTEFGTNTVTPSKSDRIAGGNGTLFSWNDVDGSPDVVAKGTLDNPLTLSNSSTLSRPASSPVNGATQAAINTNFENTWAGTGGVDGDGMYVVKSGTNFLDGNADLNEDILDLDEKLQCAWDSANNLNTRVEVIENAGGGGLVSFGNRPIFSDSFNDSGTGTKSYGPFNLETLTSVPSGSTSVIIKFSAFGTVDNLAAGHHVRLDVTVNGGTPYTISDAARAEARGSTNVPTTLSDTSAFELSVADTGALQSVSFEGGWQGQAGKTFGLQFKADVIGYR